LLTANVSVPRIPKEKYDFLTTQPASQPASPASPVMVREMFTNPQNTFQQTYFTLQVALRGPNAKPHSLPKYLLLSRDFRPCATFSQTRSCSCKAAQAAQATQAAQAAQAALAAQAAQAAQPSPSNPAQPSPRAQPLAASPAESSRIQASPAESNRVQPSPAESSRV